MKRYEIYTAFGEPSWESVEAPDGDYVNAEEALARIAELEAALAAADAAAIETIRELTAKMNGWREECDHFMQMFYYREPGLAEAQARDRKRGEALEAALAEAQALALANGMRADAAERRIAKAIAIGEEALRGE